MNYTQNPKVIGAFLVGFAMVTGAYVVANFGQPVQENSQGLTATAAEAPVRLFVPVQDSDEDGVEDWRDQFVQAPAFSTEDTDIIDYVAPTTYTAKISVAAAQGLLLQKTAAPISTPVNTIIDREVAKVEKEVARDYIYDSRDAKLSYDLSDEAIRLYGNTLAEILISERVAGLENELTALEEYLKNPTEDTLSSLAKVATIYKNYRDRTLETPVPRNFLKQHLDLVNVYNALAKDVEAMLEVATDPLVTFVRIKRYRDDLEGSNIALSNMYDSLAEYARVFEMDDPVMVFTEFYQSSP